MSETIRLIGRKLPPVAAPQFPPEAPAPAAPARRLNIVHVVPSVDPATGGPAAVSIRLAAAQAALGHKATVVSTLANGRRAAFDEANGDVPDVHRVPLLACPWTGAAAQFFGARVLPLYQSLLPFADVVHIHGIWEPILLAAARQAYKRNIPYIVRPCGMLDPWSLRQKRLKKFAALSLFHNRFINRAAFLHVLNADESRLIAPRGFAPPHVVIPNGVNLKEIDDDSGEQAFASLLPQLARAPYVLFAGRLHHKKGLDLLVEAFAVLAKLHPDLHLLAIGPDGGAKAALLKTCAARGISQRVHFPGPLYGAVKFAAFRNAACLCQPSRQEGFSLTIAEALACRVPVAISTDSHFPEVDAAGAGVLVTLDVDSISKTLAGILALPPRMRRAMGSAGRELIEREYTWRRVAQMTAAAYGVVLASR